MVANQAYGRCRDLNATSVLGDLNPDTRVKIPDAMRIKGYSLSEATDRSLQMQVRCERRKVDKITGEDIPGPSAPVAVAASALLTLLTTANVAVLPSTERKAKSKSTNKMRQSARPYTPRPTRMRPLLLPKRG